MSALEVVEVGGDNVARSFVQDATAINRTGPVVTDTCKCQDQHLTKSAFASVGGWVSVSAVRVDCVQRRTEHRALEREQECEFRWLYENNYKP